MSRSISQIYAEAVAKRNNYLQLSPLNSERSEAKLSVINILTYVMAALIYSYEILLDVFQVQIANLIAKRINGTGRYYAQMAMYFQYNPDTETMDEMVFDESDFNFKFKNINKEHRIVVKSVYQNYKDIGGVIKVCKENTDKSTGSPSYCPLTEKELMAFDSYMDEIKFLGAKLIYRSSYGDLLSINATIVYDELYVDKDTAFQNVQTALINYISNQDFNGYIYYQSIIDAIQSAGHIITVSGPNETTAKYAVVTIAEYDTNNKKYGEAKELTGRSIPASGYLTFVDETSEDKSTTLVIDDTHLIFKSSSEVA